MPKDIILFWIPEGMEPLSSLKPASCLDPEDWQEYNCLCSAVADALNSQSAKKKRRKLPWIRAGSGKGAAVFNYQGIILLDQMYQEGVKQECRSDQSDCEKPTI